MGLDEFAADAGRRLRAALIGAYGRDAGIAVGAAGTVHLRQASPPGGAGSPWLANADLTTFDDGTFELELPAGTYQVWGTSPEYQSGGMQCPSDGTTATVRQGEISALVLDCPMN